MCSPGVAKQRLHVLHVRIAYQLLRNSRQLCLVLVLLIVHLLFFLLHFLIVSLLLTVLLGNNSARLL